jgi:hypothetical protein
MFTVGLEKILFFSLFMLKILVNKGWKCSNLRKKNKNGVFSAKAEVSIN